MCFLDKRVSNYLKLSDILIVKHIALVGGLSFLANKCPKWMLTPNKWDCCFFVIRFKRIVSKRFLMKSETKLVVFC